MANKIKYPRSAAKFRFPEKSEELKRIQQEITEIKNSDIYKKLLELNQKLKNPEDNIKFVCFKCEEETDISKLTLYNYITFSNSMDNYRYDDYNIICPKCGAFNFIRAKKDINLFKKVKEIY